MTEFLIEQRFGRCCIDFFYIFPTIQKINGTIQIFNSNVRVTIRIRILTNKFRNANIFLRLCKLTLKYGRAKKKHSGNLILIYKVDFTVIIISIVDIGIS